MSRETVEERVVRVFGCPLEQAVVLNNGLPLTTPLSAAERFRAQQQRARKAGIGWSLTFSEWLAVWRQAGGVHLCGRGKDGHGLRRIDRSRPYCLTNVEIKKTTEISASGGRKAQVTLSQKPAEVPPILGTGRGWSLRDERRFTLRPYQVMVSSKYVGCFATQSEAEAAYERAVQVHGAHSVRNGRPASQPYSNSEDTLL